MLITDFIVKLNKILFALLFSITLLFSTPQSSKADYNQSDSHEQVASIEKQIVENDLNRGVLEDVDELEIVPEDDLNDTDKSEVNQEILEEPELVDLNGEDSGIIEETEVDDQLDENDQIVVSEETIEIVEDQIPNIETYSNKRVEAFIRMYTNRKRHVFEQAIERKPVYWDMMTRIFREYGLPDNLAYLSIVESNLNPKARSSANALGIWQFMKYSGRIFGLNGSWWHDDRYDPVKSTHAAAKYLKSLKQTFGDWERALAAYNSGPGTVRKAIRKAKRRGKSTDYWSLKLPRETRGYVPAFFAVATIFNNLEEYGFTPDHSKQVKSLTNVIEVPGGVSFQHIAKALNINSEVIAELNPALTKGMTPANKEIHELFIPKETIVEAASLEELKKHRQKFWKTHKIRSGDTLWGISINYGIPIHQIYSFNRMRKNNLLRIGRKLMLPVPSTWKHTKKKKYSFKTVVAKNKQLGYNHTYVVKSGDTLWDISQRFNISLRALKNWNSRIRNKRLQVGSFLRMKLPLNVAQST